MTRWIHLTVAFVAAASLAACTGGADPYNDTTDATDPIGTPGAATTAMNDTVDRGFVEDMITNSTKEIEVSQLAQQQAANAQVKAFAQEVTQDHQQATEALRQVATQQNVQVTPDSDAIQDAREELTDLSGAQFDRAYIDMMVEDHQAAVSEVEGKATDSANPEVQQWATRTLPTLREHLDRARQLQETLEE
jgi:putative membrane protein